jgi:murein DD-endopeptidase MepM/ murein hydrolase activator NlpD
MTVSNSPAADASRKVIAYTPQVRLNGVALILNPAPGACLSSGFGMRSGRMHSGVDYHAAMGTPIIAAADGIILEAVFRNDFGNMLIVDHGHGVYTRYCHMKAFADDMAPGARVKAGEVIGYMGNTANPPVAVHLHYEMLTGTYDTPKKSFGLTAVDPFAQPPA